MRNPDPERQRNKPPRTGLLFAVRYRDTRGESVTTLFRRKGSAELYAAKVRARGGLVNIYRTDIKRWLRS